MGIEDIGATSSNFSDLQYYADLTVSEQDDQALQQLNQLIMEAVPGKTAGEIGEEIDRIIKNNPDMSMDDVFAQAVENLSPGEDKTAAINEIRTAWQDFIGVSNLSDDDVGAILTDPSQFYLDETGVTRVVDILSILMALMIEIAGEESKDMLAESFQKRDEVMNLAQQKASELRNKAILNCVLGCVTAAIQAIAACVQIGMAGAAFKSSANAKGNIPGAEGYVADKSQMWNSLGQAIGGLGQSASALCNAFNSLGSGLFDAAIAVKDGESQVANIQKETADKLRQKVQELIQAMLQVIKSVHDAEYQTMTSIGRV